ncbi:hypothetical protein PHYSODRAFT_532799 [Phytophthora sojae]|uniref:Spermatogenesis-associated protein 4 n=1 Tax=Phytophthora sojae (strain P6497) TaxID=1094619 RepID=G5AF45_PHYSP|nr:hypothetical protein PHYSODRAFT_532799 [Phytophthora sojae]EGZ05835.1 hypothetical protein PHYSODRAFT_532799 [Phytophthora sojae]|eukprot:XP_009538696.1 hypothetical protein PHYSODRAFT_532799 [Phytophthora sojae]
MGDADAKSNKLNRELLRWIQSLDLAYSIKNVKRRDFANGFLVAEILSRYYDKDISMHSYDNGIGMKVKKDNWDQLAKIFGRFVDLEPLTNKADIDAIIHCQNGAAVAFLTKLYQCLTKRTIQPTAVTQPPTAGSGNIAAPASVAKGLDTVEEIPPYAKPTNSAFIRDKMREPEIAETKDQTQLNRKMRDIHSQHEETQQLERLMTDTPDRYPTLRSASKATVLRGATKPVRNDDSNPVLMTQQVVREVQIKTINQKGLEKLRATREAKESESLGFSGHSSSGLLGEGRNGVASFDTRGMNGGGNSNPELVQRRRPMDLLNEAVTRKLASMGLTLKPRGGKDKFENFIDNAYEGHIFGDHECAEVIRGIEEEAELLAVAFLDFPREFWKFVGLMHSFFTEHDENHVFFRASAELFQVLGQYCVRRDATAASLLMPEFLLPKFTPILSRYANKRAPLLRIFYAFLPNTVLAHIQAIKHLREALANDIPLFVHMLTILIGMENELDDTLVDLYHYYCCIGLETPCEKLRAACLSMLIPFLNYDVNLVLDLLPRLTQLSSRHAWWEVKAQLLIVASAFLRTAPTHRAQSEDDAGDIPEEPTRDFTEQIELCLTIIEREFHPEASLNLRRVGLSYLARNLEQYQELVPLYVDVLLSLPGSLPVHGASGATYQLLPLVANWDSVAIAKQVFYEHKNQSSANTDVLLVMLKCFEQLLHSGQTLNVRMLYDQMKGYIVLGFGSPGTCEISANIVKVALAALDGSETDVFQHVALVETLQRLVTRNVDDIRQQTVVKLLHDAHVMSPQWAEKVLRCVNNLRSMCDADTFKSSLFSIAFELDG